MTANKRISRRAALARLGLSVAGAYMAPVMLGLSTAHAASRASGPSPASAPSPASSPSPPSRPSPASNPSPPSAPSAPSNPSGPSRSTRQSGTSGPSGSSEAGSCQQTALPNGGQITRRDYERAQQAISRGDAQPLRNILDNVQEKYPGRLLRVGFSQNGRAASFRIAIVTPSGAIVSVTVDAKSGQITNVQGC